MSEQAAQDDKLLVEIGGHKLPYGKLSMRDFGKLGEYMDGTPSYNEIVRWCGSPGGALACLELAASKVDATINEEAITGMGTAVDIADAAVVVVRVSNGMPEQPEEKSDGKGQDKAKPKK